MHPYVLAAIIFSVLVMALAFGLIIATSVW